MSDLGRILIADDEEIVLMSTAALLRRKGYECDCASDAETAAGMLKEKNYDLLISDVRMSGNSELELIKDLPTIAKGLPVILMTGYPSLHSAIQALQLPVVAYLAKPIDFDELFSSVDSAIERYRTYRSINNIQKRLKDWRNDLNNLEEHLKEAPREKSQISVRTFLNLTLSNITGCLADMKHITDVLTLDGPSQENACQLFNCPRPTQLTEALQETIAILEKTKTAFKSKELGELRKKLETLLISNPSKTSTLEKNT